MQKAISFILLCQFVSSADLYFYPSLTDTAIISFDPLRISTQCGDLATFSCNWSEKLIHKDSVTWSIDGKIPDAGEVYIRGGANPRDVSPDFSTGSYLSISQGAISKNTQGVHSVELVARFPDSVVTATWHFRYFETQYKEIRAQAIIDSSWNSYDESWSNYTRYKLLSVQPADTSIFGNAGEMTDTSLPLSSLDYDTIGITREYLAKKGGMGTLVPKGTVDCMIIQIIRGAAEYNEWLDPVPIAPFLKQTNPPFPISAALHSFTIYAAKNNIERRSNSPEGDFKLGPIFSLGAGDPGWSLTASHDESYWYFVYRLGYGDCPCGCTEWDTYTYQVSSDGTVQKMPATTVRPIRSVSSLKITKPGNAQCYYNLKGQRLAETIHSAVKAKEVLILSNNGNPSKFRKVTLFR
jgi:hypothetical protein